MDGMGSTHSLGDKRYLFQGEELTHEPRIPVSNGGHLYALKYICSPESLRDESSSIASKLHQCVDE
jgi:hypothetical protein